MTIERMEKGLRLVRVTCKAQGRSYEARLGEWHERHGFTCVACGMDQPTSCPDHEIAGARRRGRR